MSLREDLAPFLSGRVVVLGVGNPLRGDDAAGCFVAQRLQGRCAARVIEAEEVPESYLGDVAARRPDAVVLVDAVDLGYELGAVAMLEQEQVAAYPATTHRLPLSLVMDVIRRQTGARVVLIGIQPGRVEFGTELSPQVAASVEMLAGLLSELLPERQQVHAPAAGGRPGERLA